MMLNSDTTKTIVKSVSQDRLNDLAHAVAVRGAELGLIKPRALVQYAAADVTITCLCQSPNDQKDYCRSDWLHGDTPNLEAAIADKGNLLMTQLESSFTTKH